MTLGGRYYWYILSWAVCSRKEVVLMKAKLETALNIAAAAVVVLDLTVKFVRGVASAVDATKASS